MDPLSVSASIIAIVQLTSKVIQYLHEVKDASAQCEQCVIEASNMLGPLTVLRYRAEHSNENEPWYQQLRLLNAKDGPLPQYKQALEILEDRTQPREGVRKIKSRLSWPFKKEEVMNILGRMERLKSLISVALEMDHLSVSDMAKAAYTLTLYQASYRKRSRTMLQRSRAFYFH